MINAAVMRRTSGALQHVSRQGFCHPYRKVNQKFLALAEEFHLASLEIYTAEVSDWILLSADPGILGIPPLAAAGHPIELDSSPVLWTDDYSNFYSLLRSW